MTISKTIEKLFPEKSVRYFLVLMMLLFTATFPAGMLATDPALQEMAKTLVELIKAPVGEMAGGAFFLILLANNIVVSLLLMFLGIIGGIVPLLSVGANGFMLGMVCRHIMESEGARQAALNLFPHAIFGIPALLVVAAYGFWLGVGTIQRFRGKEERNIRELANIALRRYFTLVFPLLVASTAAETFMVLRGG
jgi:stage II sporulation protein M